MKAFGLACLIVGSMLAPIAPAAVATPGSALLITRMDNEQWKLRLVAGGADAQFSGVVESDRAISGVRGATSAAAAKAQLSSATSLGTTLAASAGFDMKKWAEPKDDEGDDESGDAAKKDDAKKDKKKEKPKDKEGDAKEDEAKEPVEVIY